LEKQNIVLHSSFVFIKNTSNNITHKMWYSENGSVNDMNVVWAQCGYLSWVSQPLLQMPGEFFKTVHDHFPQHSSQIILVFYAT
jgi:hypothetical protein